MSERLDELVVKRIRKYVYVHVCLGGVRLQGEILPEIKELTQFSAIHNSISLIRLTEAVKIGILLSL